MEAVPCLDCGFMFGAYFEAFRYMEEIWKTSKRDEVHVDKKFIDPNADNNLIPIFKALQIDKYCCRGQSISCRGVRDIGL